MFAFRETNGILDDALWITHPELIIANNACWQKLEEVEQNDNSVQLTTAIVF